MAKDYTPRARAAARRKSGGGTLLGIFIGLIIGLAIAVGIAWYMNKTPIPFLHKPKPPEKAAEPGKALSKPDEKTTQQVEKPRFEFYKILPGAEEPVSEREIKQAAKPGAPTENFLLQAGAFQNPADADNLKARLALLGVEAGVEPINLAEKGTWYRVRIGPYTKVDEINRVRQTLAQNGIEASLVKLKDSARR